MQWGWKAKTFPLTLWLLDLCPWHRHKTYTNFRTPSIPTNILLLCSSKAVTDMRALRQLFVDQLPLRLGQFKNQNPGTNFKTPFSCSPHLPHPLHLSTCLIQLLGICHARHQRSSSKKGVGQNGRRHHRSRPGTTASLGGDDWKITR